MAQLTSKLLVAFLALAFIPAIAQQQPQGTPVPTGDPAAVSSPTTNQPTQPMPPETAAPGRVTTTKTTTKKKHKKTTTTTPPTTTPKAG